MSAPDPADAVNSGQSPADDAPAAAPERSCIVSRTVGPPGEMIRFVLAPDGQVVPDLAEKLPGRGAWVTGTAALVNEAVKRGAFARSFKKPARAAPELAATIETLLRMRALEAFAIANKAGLVIAGHAKIEAKLREKPMAALVHAVEAGADGCRKLNGLAARQGRTGQPPARIENLFSSAQLDLALGRSNVIHAAIARGGSADLFVQRCRRLAYFCSGKLIAFDVMGEATVPPEDS